MEMIGGVLNLSFGSFSEHALLQITIDVGFLHGSSFIINVPKK